MDIRYYLSVNPLEALIASQLTPQEFGRYMATGKKNGSYERIMFIEVEGGFGDYFDWDYAQKRCVPHEDGRPKNSVWMSVYRALEHVELDKLRSLYMTTLDGRTLEIPRSDYTPSARSTDYFFYQELCPITPLVVRRFDPAEFCTYMIDLSNKVSVPKVVFADLKTIDFDHPERTGNIGGAYDKNIEHLRDCIQDVRTQKEKPNKNVERSVSSFSYQIIDSGVFVGEGDNLVEYAMPTVDDLRQHHYEWARSAMIV